MKKFVIIVAGGAGVRMKADIPKQFLNINGLPILFHTVKCFDRFIKDIPVILVLPAPYIDYWKSLCKKHNFIFNQLIAEGGETRFHSVRNGLDKINESGIVAIHDGVRPLVSDLTLQRVFDAAEKNGNAIPAIGIQESLREVHNDNSTPVCRDKFRIIQTPQCFHTEIIKKAYLQKYKPEFTDDASVVEAFGVKINLVEGNPENLKITRQSDLRFAEALLKQAWT